MRAVLRFILLFSCQAVAAHDFWVQPNEYRSTPWTVIPVTLQVGHGPFRLRSPIPLRRITRFTAITSTGATLDLRDHLQLGEKTEDGHLQFQTPGTYLLVLQTDNRAETHLPAIRFNDYLKVEGLTPALELRARTHRMDADGSENYSRCAKSIVQVGSASGAAGIRAIVGTNIGSAAGVSGETPRAQITKPVGLPLEIVPEQDPFASPRPANLPVRVLYEGHPLSGALVKLTNLANDAAPFETHPTDSTGHATFTLPTSGTWLLNVIWTKPQPPSSDTDFETIFSSLSFGFPPT